MDETLLILEKVHSFYNTAWSQLVTYTLGLLAFVGGLIPLLIHYHQNKQFKREQETLKREIGNEVLKARDELLAGLKGQFESEEKKFVEKLKGLQENFEKKICTAEGRAFHIQGGNNIDEKRYKSALQDFVAAARGYLKGEDELNLQRALLVITDTCLPKVAAKEIEDNPDLVNEIEKLLGALKAADVNGRYTDTIRKIKKGLQKARVHGNEKEKQ